MQMPLRCNPPNASNPLLQPVSHSINLKAKKQSKLQVALNQLKKGLDNGIAAYSAPEQRLALTSYLSFCRAFLGSSFGFHNYTLPFSISITIDIGDLTLDETDDGIELTINQVTVLLPDITLPGLTKKMIADIIAKPQRYGKALSAHAHNITHYGNSFRITNKSLNSCRAKKNLPYFSTKGEQVIQNLNSRAVTSSQEAIQCRHLAAYMALMMLQHTKGKFDFNLFSSTKSIGAAVPDNIEAIYNALKEQATDTHIIRNHALGIHLKSFFLEMQRTKKSNAIKILLIESTTHTMLIRLRMKKNLKKKHEPIYVVTFFEPNRTNVALRFQCTDLSVLEKKTLRKLVNGSLIGKLQHYELFYQNCAPISLLIECNPNTHLDGHVAEPIYPSPIMNRDSGLSGEAHCGVENPLSPLATGIFTKKLASTPLFPLTPTYLFYLMSENLAADLADLIPTIQLIGEQSQEKLIQLLFAKNRAGIPGLFIAMQNGYADIVNVMKKCVIFVVDENKRAEIISATHSYDLGNYKEVTSAFYIAMQNGRTKAILAYTGLTRLISDEAIRANLIASIDSDNTPALFIAMQNGHASAVKAFEGYLAQITTESRRVELVAAKRKGVFFAMTVAMKNNRQSAISAYFDLLALLAAESRDNLIADINEELLEFELPTKIFLKSTQ